MNESVYLLIGSILLIIIIYDFFYTTLSISGAGFISRNISLVSYQIIKLFTKICGRRAYAYSGLIINLIIFFTWLIVVWAGLFLLFSSDPEAIMSSQGKTANTIERLYFTAYILSTLGMGDFFPTSISMEILSGVFSFFGFIFFTSSITYFLSISSAVINQRTLARSIERFGKTPEKIATKFLKIDTSYANQQFLEFQKMLDTHVANHQAYPVIHYYSHPQPSFCLGLNIVRLDEAISILLSSEDAVKIKEEANILRSALTGYLTHLDKNYSFALPKGEDAVPLEPLNYKITGIDSADLDNRRKILRGILRSEGYEWKDISPRNQR